MTAMCGLTKVGLKKRFAYAFSLCALAMVWHLLDLSPGSRFGRERLVWEGDRLGNAQRGIWRIKGRTRREEFRRMQRQIGSHWTPAVLFRSVLSRRREIQRST